MSKNVVIFSDGTGQDGGVRAEQRLSNVYKMYRACRVGPESAIDPEDQVAFYDPGLGTETTATGMTGLVRWIQKLLASVSGRGITTNIVDCYEFILNHYTPGDRIFLLGFSRGAYTVRSLANLLMLCGVPSRDGDQQLQRFRRSTRLIADEAVHVVLEHGAGHPRGRFEDERLELAQRFRAKYGSDHASGEPHRSNAAPYFIGVFDTVAALGARGPLRLAIKAGLMVMAFIVALPVALVLAGLLFLIGLPFWWSFAALVVASGVAAPAGVLWHLRKSVRKTIRDFPNPGDRSSHNAEWKGENFDRLLSRFVGYARSANAIDETREDFARVPWGPTMEMPERRDGIETFKQLWFAGNHSDIGGSYSEAESRLSDIALQWMIEEAVGVPNGLKIGPVMVDGILLPGTGPRGVALNLHPSAAGVQHCEVAGMSDVLDARVPRWIRPHVSGLVWKAAPRPLRLDATVHPTVEERFRLSEVPQCAGAGPYRPKALREHENFRRYYTSEDYPGSSATLRPQPPASTSEA